jgi:hypothetical protein
MACAPFWLCLAAGLGTAPAARAVSLPCRPERQAGVAVLSTSGSPGPWVWRWLNPDAPAPADENDGLPLRLPDSDAARGGGEAPDPLAPRAPDPDQPPRPAAHAAHTSGMTGGDGTGSAGGKGPSQTGLAAALPPCVRSQATRLPAERAVLHLAEHHDRVFRPPRRAG